MNRTLREILISLSLANLLFIGAWWRPVNLLNEPYFWKQPPSYIDFLAVMLNVAFFGIIFFLGAAFLRVKHQNGTPKIAKIGFIGIFLIALNGIRIQFYETQLWLIEQTGFLLFTLLFAVVAFGIAMTAYKFRKWLVAAIKTVLLIVSPFILFTFVQSIAGIYSVTKHVEPAPVSINQIASKDGPQKLNKRVVWIIFDEMDYRMAFEKLPANVKLPALEQLKRESFFATNATSPARNTLESIPSLTTGKVISKAKIIGTRELALQAADKQETFIWGDTESVFSQVKKFGGNTGLAGWYHPYCDIFGKNLDTCLWEEHDISVEISDRSLFSVMVSNIKNLLFSLPFGYRLHLLFVEYMRKDPLYIEKENSCYKLRHEKLIRQSLAIASSKNIDLAFLHLPFPHAPNIYNPKNRDFSGGRDYFDNLLLTDRVLGEIRRHMEMSGVWDESTVIISSDHHWRVENHLQWLSQEEIKATGATEDRRIPFIIKLGNSTQGTTYDKPFVTTVTNDIILGIMKGDVTTYEHLSSFIDNKANDR